MRRRVGDWRGGVTRCVVAERRVALAHRVAGLSIGRGVASLRRRRVASRGVAAQRQRGVARRWRVASRRVAWRIAWRVYVWRWRWFHR
ncbi:hypothetical protein ACXZ9C_10650 [Streptococcus agalactiae]